MEEFYDKDHHKVILNWNDIEGIGVDKKKNNLYMIYVLYKIDKKINYFLYKSYDNINSVKNDITEKINLIKKGNAFINEYAYIPKYIINGSKFNDNDGKYEMIIITDEKKEFLINCSSDKDKINNLIDLINEIIKQNLSKIEDNLVSSVVLPEESFIEPPEYERINSSLGENKKIKRKIDHDDSPLDEIIITKIINLEIFKKIINETIMRITIDEEYGTTLADICKSIHSNLEYHKGKKLGDQETIYVLNELRKIFPNRLLKRGISYSLYDINSNKHGGATTVFRGLKFEDRLRKLPKAYRK